MRICSLEMIPFEPVSHDPGLKKRVLVKDFPPFIKNISHIIMKPGEKASEHSHPDAFEVFYCIRGVAIFKIEDMEATLKKGSCLIIEPKEQHSIDAIIDDTELLYFRVTFIPFGGL